MSSDDQLWAQAMVVNRHLKEGRQENRANWTDEERKLWVLLRMGVLDVADDEQQKDQFTRAMRHSSAMVDQLWSMLEIERNRVGRRPL